MPELQARVPKRIRHRIHDGGFEGFGGGGVVEKKNVDVAPRAKLGTPVSAEGDNAEIAARAAHAPDKRRMQTLQNSVNGDCVRRAHGLSASPRLVARADCRARLGKAVRQSFADGASVGERFRADSADVGEQFFRFQHAETVI